MKIPSPLAAAVNPWLLQKVLNKYNRRLCRVALSSVMLAGGLQCASEALAAPAALLSYGLVTNQIGITYNVPVSDTDPTKYSLNQLGSSVDTVVSSTPTNLTLNLSGLTNSVYDLTYIAVPDTNGNPGSGTVHGTNYGLTPLDVGTGAYLPSSYESIGTPSIPDLTRVTCVGEQIEYNFNFLYTTITGNFDMRVNLRGGVSGVSYNNNYYAYGGVAVRAGLDSTGLEPYMFMGVGLPNSTGFPLWLTSYRSTTNGTAGSLDFPSRDPNVFPNAWLRITRHESVLNTYRSSDGTNWISSSGDIVNGWTNTLYVGLASVGYGGDTAPPVSTFDYGHFSLVSLPPTTNAQITITQQPTNRTVLTGAGAAFSVAATVTNGSPALLTYQWRSNGVDIAAATNATYSLANAYSNATYSVRVASIQSPNDVVSSNATLTVLLDNSPAVGILSYGLVTNQVGILFDDTVMDTNVSKYTLNRPGATVDGVQLSTPTNLTLQVSGLTNTTYNITYTGVSDAAGHTISGTLPGTNTYRLTPIDIGTGAALPSSFDSIATPSIPDMTRVTCVGEQIEYNFNFLYTKVTGNFDVRVNLRGGVSALSYNNNRYGYGGVVVRTGLAQLDGYLVSAVGLPNSGGFPLWLAHYRPVPNGAASTLSAPGRDPNVFPNAWLRITRMGQQFTAYYSQDGVNWINSNGGVTITNDWANELYVGLASVGYGGDNQPPASTFDYGNFSITPLFPTVISATRDYFQANKVSVVFSAPMDTATATNIGNYSLNNGSTVSGAALSGDGTTVVLTTSPLSNSATNVLTINNVQDTYGTAVAAGTKVTVSTPSDPVRAQYNQAGTEFVSLEAEHFNLNTSAGGSWVFTTLPPTLQPTDANTNYSGVGAMYSSPNVGANFGTPALGTVPSATPRLDYSVQFTNAGTFYVWVRGVGDSGGASVNDSVFVGLDGHLTTRLTGFQIGQGYTWGNAPVGDSGPIVANTAGNHVVNVWVREDGFVADKILLVSDSAYVPSGNGPSESAGIPAISPIRLTAARSGNSFTLTWPGVGALQSSTNVVGPYIDVRGASSPYTVAPSGTMTFYRVRE